MPNQAAPALDQNHAFPGKTYAEVVLSPAYDHAKEQLLSPMLDIHRAHLIMLREQSLIDEQDADAIGRALQALDAERLREASYTGEFEDLFFEVEQELHLLAGEAAGNLHIGRSRNDMGIAIYRLTLREKLLHTLESALFLEEHLLQFARSHVDTIMIGYTHTQQAQPTTLGHYTAAVSDSLSRDIRRLQSAYANCNRSSMGAAALTTSGFPLNRQRIAELLAFDGLIENAYDAVSGADYVGEIATSVQLAAINLGRFIQELLLWSTQEFAVLQVAAPYVQISSIMPQKRNPVSIEHMRSLLSSCVGLTQTVLSMIHNTPFGDIVDTEDDMQPYAWKSLAVLSSVYRLLANVIATLSINKEALEARVEASFSTVTELADTLVREEKLSFRTAHHIVSDSVRKALVNGNDKRFLTLSVLNESALEVIGRKLSFNEEKLALALNAKHFVQVRTLIGGPNANEVERALNGQTQRLNDDKAWLTDKRRAIRAAQEDVERELQKLFL
ncbi:argininosuccinate lyase [Paenibacillus marchantiophytorum]|uniref:Argininosuccinate lyase n=1 Tax=Paenibacillus marchantiophytorum TaxID=1619310 RepID=A0ABQ1EN72_9BACL|nr:argininosuccinate lyase [Paenibacillus marchantiophytorum]GFZ79484.1 argininosuccinate lyase [Paenibacillus marchantiophytorum]